MYSNAFSFLNSTTPLLLKYIPRKLRCLSSTASKMSAFRMKIVPVPPVIPKTYMKKNEDLKRALSPHLSIYKAEITSMMSISLRMTGLALGMMAWAVGFLEFLTDQNADYYIDMLKNLELDDIYWTAARTVIVFPFAFHYVSGLRHLFFDTSKLMEKSQYYATGYTAIFLSFVLCLILANIEDIRNKLDERRLEKEARKE